MPTLVEETRPRDRGESLIEILVSISILGIAGTAILGGIGMASSTSALHRTQAQAQNVVRNWAEAVSSAPYQACAVPADFAATKPNLTDPQYAGYTATVGAVQYWNGTAFVGACSPDKGLQKVTLQLDAPQSLGIGGFTQSLDVVVRRPCAGPVADPC
jgi:type II secretory pathway pseudopilin PulG